MSFRHPVFPLPEGAFRNRVFIAPESILDVDLVRFEVMRLMGNLGFGVEATIKMFDLEKCNVRHVLNREAADAPESMVRVRELPAIEYAPMGIRLDLVDGDSERIVAVHDETAVQNFLLRHWAQMTLDILAFSIEEETNMQMIFPEMQEELTETAANHRALFEVRNALSRRMQIMGFIENYQMLLKLVVEILVPECGEHRSYAALLVDAFRQRTGVPHAKDITNLTREYLQGIADGSYEVPYGPWIERDFYRFCIQHVRRFAAPIWPATAMTRIGNALERYKDHPGAKLAKLAYGLDTALPVFDYTIAEQTGTPEEEIAPLIASYLEAISHESSLLELVSPCGNPLGA